MMTRPRPFWTPCTRRRTNSRTAGCRKTARTQAEKDRDAANGSKQAAEKALTDYKAQQTQKDTHAAKEAKFRELLKSAGVLNKYADRVVRLSGEDIDKLELDEKGNVKDAKKHTDSLKADWSDFVGTTTTTGAKVDTPPTDSSGVSKEDFAKMSLDARIKLKNENPELYQQLRKSKKVRTFYGRYFWRFPV